jgi:hypothetical protein
VRFEVTTAVLLKIQVSLDVTPCLRVVTDISEESSASVFSVKQLILKQLILKQLIRKQLILKQLILKQLILKQVILKQLILKAGAEFGI